MFILHFLCLQGALRIQTLNQVASKPRLQAGILPLVLVLSCTTGSSEMNDVCAHDRRTHLPILPCCCWFHFLLICPFRSSSFQPLDSKVSRCRIVRREASIDVNDSWSCPDCVLKTTRNFRLEWGGSVFQKLSNT